MRLLWKPDGGMRIRDVGENLFLFQFNHPEDRLRVLKPSPWTFNRHILLLEPIEGEVHLTEITSHRATFWIRIYGLPYLCLNRKVGEAIGNTLGQFEDIDIPEGGGLGHFLRIRVSLDIRGPLKRGLNFAVGSTTKTWIHLKYERLPNFCYCCGRLGHVERDCETAQKLRHEGIKGEFQHGHWLRVELDRFGGGHRMRGSTISGGHGQTLFTMTPFWEISKEGRRCRAIWGGPARRILEKGLIQEI